MHPKQSKIIIEEIPLQNMPDVITLAMLQHECPFEHAISKAHSPEGAIFTVSENNRENYIIHISKLIEMVKNLLLSNSSINILLLPEYSFLANDNSFNKQTKSTFDELKSISTSHGVILVGNQYNQAKRLSESFIVVPKQFLFDVDREDKIYIQRKLTTSRYDKSEIDVNNFDGEPAKIHRFTWHNEAAKAYFQVFTCKDFLFFSSIKMLRDYPDLIKTDFPGILLCPLSSPDIATFSQKAQSFLRESDVESGQGSIISAFCNPISVPPAKENICGGSQIVLPTDSTDEVLPILKERKEGAIVAQINPFKSLSKPTKTNEAEPNAVLLSCRILSLNKSQRNALVDVSPKIKKLEFTINPHVLNALGLKKSYGFVKLKNYISFRDKVKSRFATFPKLTIPIFSVYGNYDVMWSSWEEFASKEIGNEFLLLRLWPSLISEEIDLSRLATCVVEKTIKHRGIVLKDLPSQRDLFGPYDSEEIRNRLLNSIDNSCAANSGPEVQEFNERCMMRTEFPDSDISLSEKAEGKVEFLIIIKFIWDPVKHGNLGVKAQVKAKNSLAKLISDPRVRTIEEVRGNSHGFFEADFIIHFVGHLSELNDLVINDIHGSMGHSLRPEFSLSTEVLLPAELLASESFPCLAEQSKLASTEAPLLDLVKHWKEMPLASSGEQFVPSIIYHASTEVIKICLSSYYLTDQIISRHGLDTNWLEDFFAFIYGSMLKNYGKEINYDLPITKCVNLCSPYIAGLGRALEKAFCSTIKTARFSSNDDTMNLLVASMANALDRDSGRFAISKLSLGNISFIIECLLSLKNQNAKTKFDITVNNLGVQASDVEVCYDALVSILSPITSKPDLLHIKNFTEIRNFVSHSQREQECASEKWLIATFEGLRFLDKLLSCK